MGLEAPGAHCHLLSREVVGSGHLARHSLPGDDIVKSTSLLTTRHAGGGVGGNLGRRVGYVERVA